MRIFIDSANIEEIKEINNYGFLAGVTTNPSLVAQENKEYKLIIKDICELIDGPVSAEVIAVNADDMLKEALQLAEIHHNVVIKVPLTADGLSVISQLKKKRIRSNATLIFSPAQALLAARAGAGFVSPFIGRVDDNGNDGLLLLQEIMTIFDKYILGTEVIAASIRHPQHVVESAKIGAHIATIPPNIIKQLINHPMTDIGIDRFMRDWRQAFPQV